MSRRRGKGTQSALPIIFMIAFLIVVVIGLAILLAPEKEPAPPVSSMTYQSRPAVEPSDALPLMPYRSDGNGNDGNEASPTEIHPAETVVASTEEAVGKYQIRGTVVDAATGAPINDAYLVASRIPTESEVASHEERDAAVIAEKDGDGLTALIEEKQRLWADAGGRSNDQGAFHLPITEAGDYQITVHTLSHLKEIVEPHYVGAEAPDWNVRIELRVGATVAGRIVDSFDNEGIEGLTVNATLEAEHQYQQAVTDSDGNYLIGGLRPGTYSIIADIEQTAYRVSKEIPFKRTTISAPDQAVKNVDFKLDKGGVVWGYITTPDNEPIAADVVLCTSESVLTQALSAMVRQAPPLNTNSKKEDGYYELVGVPLNEPWRLYATAKDSAPQLADPFLLTDRQKEARVDIFMFTGSNVYGQVVDGDGAGVPEAQILCIPGFAQLLTPLDSPQAVRETQSDEDGYFEVKELPAGNYQVMAQKEGYKFALRGEPLRSDGYHEIKNFQVVLEEAGTGRYSVFGTVKDSTGANLSGAKVFLSGLGTENLQGVGREETTNGSGEFVFDGVEIGTYMLRAEYEGYSPKTLGRVLLDEPNTIVMRASATVRGRVLVKNSRQAPENGYTVRAALLEGTDEDSESGGIMAIMESAVSGETSHFFQDPQGQYEMSLAAGTWRLEGSARGLTPARQPITLEPGQVLENIDLLLSEDGGVISGQVIMADGRSPQGTQVSLIEAGSASEALSSLAAGENGELPSMYVDADGQFRFEQLSEGTYNVIARHAAYPQAMSASVPLQAEETVGGVEVRLGPGGTLEGFVYYNGAPRAGTVVTLVAGGVPYTGTSDERGYYEIRNIPSGEYEVFSGEVGTAIIGDSVGGQGYPVIIEDGLITRQNFGDSNGISIEVTVVGRRGFLAATLNPPGAPVHQGDVELTQLSGYRSYVYGDVIRFEEIPLGDWQLDLYAAAGLSNTTLTWTGTELVSVTGEEPEMAITVVAQ